ncbi:hypothetical protein D3C80_1787950 [compost metagenome]
MSTQVFVSGRRMLDDLFIYPKGFDDVRVTVDNQLHEVSQFVVLGVFFGGIRHFFDWKERSTDASFRSEEDATIVNVRRRSIHAIRVTSAKMANE